MHWATDLLATMPKVYNYRELIKHLTEHDPRFEILKRRGKGSERLLVHPNVNGRKQSYPIPCHGRNSLIRKGHYGAIRKRSDLPDDFFD